MRDWKARSVLAALAVGGALVLGGCGDGDSSTGADRPETTPKAQGDAMKGDDAMHDDAMKNDDAMHEDAMKSDNAMHDEAMKGDDAMKSGADHGEAMKDR